MCGVMKGGGERMSIRVMSATETNIIKNGGKGAATRLLFVPQQYHVKCATVRLRRRQLCLQCGARLHGAGRQAVHEAAGAAMSRLLYFLPAPHLVH